MKKAMVVFLMLLGMTVLFAGTWKQTIVLVSVVEKIVPEYSLGIAYVENGYAEEISGSEVLVGSHNIGKDVEANLFIGQALSRYRGEVRITVTASELSFGGYHTERPEISGHVSQVAGRQGYTEEGSNGLVVCLDYSGKTVDTSVAAEISIRYKGNANLPQGDYVSHVRMVVESK